MFPGGSWGQFRQQNPDDFAAFEDTQFPWAASAGGGQRYPSARRFD